MELILAYPILAVIGLAFSVGCLGLMAQALWLDGED